MTVPATTDTLDLAKVRSQIERHLEKRSRLLDRSAQLAVVPEARAHSRAKSEGAWAHRAMPSDPPLIQMILYLSDQLENGAWKAIDDDFKRCQMQNQITKQLTDLLSALEDKSSSAFDELCTLINQHMRKSEHDEKMKLAGAKIDPAAKDAELIAEAAAEGILLPGAGES